MSIKLKILGLGLLAMLATSAFAVMNAGASSGGHFVNDAPNGHAIIKGVESGSHRLHLERDPSDGSQIGCSEATYTGTVNAETVTELEVTPSYSGCTTTGTATAVTVTHNECKYRFTVATGGTEGSADLVCPAGKAIEIHHPNCTITVADEHGSPSTPTNQTVPGIHYTTVTENERHAITLDVDVTFASQYHGGICIFLGTSQFGALKGSVTVTGENTTNEPVNITAT